MKCFITMISKDNTGKDRICLSPFAMVGNNFKKTAVSIFLAPCLEQPHVEVQYEFLPLAPFLNVGSGLEFNSGFYSFSSKKIIYFRLAYTHG